MRLVVLMSIVGLACAGCVTTGADGQGQMAAASDQGKAGDSQQKKQSLNKMLDEHDTVTLVDDETGETKLICKREPVLGTRLGGKKICGTRKQWEDQRKQSQKNVDRLQRGLMDSRCPQNHPCN